MSLGANFVSVSSTQEFINYLNTGYTSKTEGTRANKITSMVIYGHGYPGVLDLNNEGIRQEDLKKLKPSVFDNTKTVLYTCRGANESEQEDGTIVPPIAKTIYDITGGETSAVVGRVDYAYIAYTKEEIETSRKPLEWLLSKLRDDEIETLRKEFGYLQDGARYDPIPGKQAQDWKLVEERDPSYWVTYGLSN